MTAEPNEITELRRLFHERVPEVANGVVEIKALAREKGKRAIVAVGSSDDSIDPVGSCIEQRGTRVKTILRELGDEKLDVVRWSDSLKTFLINALSPSQIEDIFIDETAHRAIIFTNFDGKQSILSDGRL